MADNIFEWDLRNDQSDNLEEIVSKSKFKRKMENIADGITNLSTNALAIYGSVEGLKYLNNLGLDNTTQALTALGLGAGLYKLNQSGLMKKLSKKVNDKIRNIKGKAMPYLRNIALAGYLGLATLTTADLVKDIKPDFVKKEKIENLIVEGVDYSIPEVITLDRRTIQGKFQRTVRWDHIFREYEQKYNIEPGILAGLVMRESYGNPLQLNNRGDGGAGLFQFQPGMARHYGLNVYGTSNATGRDSNHGQELLDLLSRLNYSYEEAVKFDDRFNVNKSTEAAARFLRDLNDYYKGDWDKSISAYNRGQRRNIPVNTPHVAAVRRYQDFYLKNVK